MPSTSPRPSASQCSIVKAICPRCNEVVITASEITMWLFGGDLAVGDEREPVSHYDFRCPLCFCRRVQPVTPAIFDALRRHVIAFEIPAEALELHDGARITTDDVLDFMLYAASTDFLDVSSW
jgi:hypothetical protein